MMHKEVLLAETYPPERVDSKRRSRFYLGISIAMLVVLFFGFSRTYYLRSIFGTRDMLGESGLPWHLLLHGFIMSAWFVLIVVQTALIQQHRVVLHRRLGYVGAALAIAVIAAAIDTILNFVPRAAATKFDPGAAIGIVVGDMLTMVVLFPLLVGAGLWFRGVPETHKRLMLLSCFVLWPPVLSRIVSVFVMNKWPMLPILGLTEFTWLIALIAYDLITRKKLHAATVWGGLVVVLARPVATVLSSTASAKNFIVSLGWYT